eukprot:CAMPEP_0176102154 /NCGR_PEP_ID=MMETSP0120_2-20121206/51239_1 /TAXON_ID=160619 /ORGANISM="Kryptoperidinium foliaceum, Strain CCMP 1326" /LENGTH=371 /DNA_ID=CAMNT_0017436211 /DNA_START=1 /DNA_END=1116 /DNA_ORIENTATION=+
MWNALAVTPGVQGKGGAGRSLLTRPQPISEKSRTALEHQLSTSANELYEGMLDLNVPMASIGSQWDKAVNLRSRLMQMYGVPAALAAPPTSGGGGGMLGGMKGGAKGGMKGGMVPPAMMMAALTEGLGAGAGESIDYKGKLNQAIGKRFKRSLAKGDLIYTVVPVEGERTYNCSLMSPSCLEAEYWNSEPAASKRAAEHGAAKAALEAEFPEVAAELGVANFASLIGQGGIQAATTGKKRKAPGDPGEDAKSQLMHSLQLLLGRPVLKTDIVYDVQPVQSLEGQAYQATVRFPEFDPSAVHQGDPAANQKQAQMNAAAVAVAVLAPTVAPLAEERKAKKARENKENLEKLKKAQQEKKEAARALREAAGVA